jgi:YesN/AraC family two-component response regulator
MAHILIIDDEPLARAILRGILTREGHSVVEAANGNDGISIFRVQPFDLVITDIIMPEKDGIQTIIELRRDYPGTRLIAISGGGRTRNLDFLKLALRYGAQKALAKPFSRDDLVEAIEAVLANAATPLFRPALQYA